MRNYIVLALFALSLTACSSFGSKDEPLAERTSEDVTVANGDAGKVDVINDVPAVPADVRDPQPTTVPRVKQAHIVGVLREMRANGCILKKVANTDGIHYSQLVITCGDPQVVPAVE